jgi:hypothetical protein
VLAGQVVRGRIDAVYARLDGADWLVVDWKTTRAADRRPLQLAIYRVAWASSPACRSSGSARRFYYRAAGRLVEPDDLPDRGDLEELLSCRSGRERDLDHLARTSARARGGVSSPVTTWSETVQMASALRPCFAASV